MMTSLNNSTVFFLNFNSAFVQPTGFWSKWMEYRVGIFRGRSTLLFLAPHFNYQVRLQQCIHVVIQPCEM